jgi:hypothetical protein
MGPAAAVRGSWELIFVQSLTTLDMAIKDFEFLRFRRKSRAQDGGGEQAASSVEGREKVVQEEGAPAVANVEVDLILFFERKQWRLIRISSFLYVISCIFLLLVSALQ